MEEYYNPHYYNDDAQVGERCFLDSKDAYMEFNADLKSFLLAPGKVEADYATAAGNSTFNLHNYDAEPMELELEFYVGGASYEDVQTNISKLFLAAKQCIIHKGNDIFEYVSVLTDRESEATDIEPYHLVTCKFASIRRKPMVENKLYKSSVIYNDGNTASGLCITFTPTKKIQSFMISGITITDLEPDITYVIDGISGRVTANGINYFAHTDIIDFPQIKPGKNEIRLSEEIPVTITYYPVYA